MLACKERCFGGWPAPVPNTALVRWIRFGAPGVPKEWWKSNTHHQGTEQQQNPSRYSGITGEKPRILGDPNGFWPSFQRCCAAVSMVTFRKIQPLLEDNLDYLMSNDGFSRKIRRKIWRKMLEENFGGNVSNASDAFIFASGWVCHVTDGPTATISCMAFRMKNSVRCNHVIPCSKHAGPTFHVNEQKWIVTSIPNGKHVDKLYIEFTVIWPHDDFRQAEIKQFGSCPIDFQQNLQCMICFVLQGCSRLKSRMEHV